MTSLLPSIQPMHRELKMTTSQVIKSLYRQARKTLLQLQYNNVTSHLTDGNLGLPTLAPFDGIIITAATAVMPPALIDQPANNSQMVLPLGDPNLSQRSCVLSKNDDGSIRKIHDEPVAFVPLINFYGE